MPLTLWDGFADGGGQIVQIKAIKPRGIFQRVKCLRWTADAKHLFLDKDAGRPGVFRQQITDGYFCIQLHFGPDHKRIIERCLCASANNRIFLVRQKDILWQKKETNPGEIHQDYYAFSEKSTRACGSAMIIRAFLDFTHPFFSQALRVRLTV